MDERYYNRGKEAVFEKLEISDELLEEIGKVLELDDNMHVRSVSFPSNLITNFSVILIKALTANEFRVLTELRMWKLESIEEGNKGVFSREIEKKKLILIASPIIEE